MFSHYGLSSIINHDNHWFIRFIDVDGYACQSKPMILRRYHQHQPRPESSLPASQLPQHAEASSITSPTMDRSWPGFTLWQINLEAKDPILFQVYEPAISGGFSTSRLVVQMVMLTVAQHWLMMGYHYKGS